MRIGLRNRSNEYAMGSIGTRHKGVAMGSRPYAKRRGTRMIGDM